MQVATGSQQPTDFSGGHEDLHLDYRVPRSPTGEQQESIAR
jgi:hypothetical protein